MGKVCSFDFDSQYKMWTFINLLDNFELAKLQYSSFGDNNSLQRTFISPPLACKLNLVNFNFTCWFF